MRSKRLVATLLTATAVSALGGLAVASAVSQPAGDDGPGAVAEEPTTTTEVDSDPTSTTAASAEEPSTTSSVPTHGDEVSAFARSTELEGREKGEAISDLASRGRARGGATASSTSSTSTTTTPAEPED